MYQVKPKLFGNIDRNQNPNDPLYGVEIKTISAETIDELKEKIWDWQIDNQIGAGNWGDAPVFKNKKIIGFMSYNGKVWSTNTWNEKAKEIL